MQTARRDRCEAALVANAAPVSRVGREILKGLTSALVLDLMVHQGLLRLESQLTVFTCNLANKRKQLSK